MTTESRSPVVGEYLRVIREHVIAPLHGPVGESCFAAVMLVFASVDGLGGLTHPEHRAGNGERFRHFLPRLGGRYVSVQDALWGLRNSLLHNALNVACFLSKLDESRAAHLEQDGGMIFVHTRELVDDFERAVGALEAELVRDPALLAQADSRLGYGVLNNPSWRGQYQTTPPPGPRFVRSR